MSVHKCAACGCDFTEHAPEGEITPLTPWPCETPDCTCRDFEPGDA